MFYVLMPFGTVEQIKVSKPLFIALLWCLIQIVNLQQCSFTYFYQAFQLFEHHCINIFTFALTFSMRDVYDSYSHKHKKQLGKIKV